MICGFSLTVDDMHIPFFVEPLLVWDCASLNVSDTKKWISAQILIHDTV